MRDQGNSLAVPALTHRRLEDLYEISTLFASFESVEQTFAPVLGIATRTLPLRSAIVMEPGSKLAVWPPEAQDSEPMRAAREHVVTAYGSLVGAAATTAAVADGNHATRSFVVIPLVVAHRGPFGALQLEGAQPLDKLDLIFANAIAHQLAIALDRDRSWQRDITRRQLAEAGLSHAEQGRTHAEAQGASAERGRIIAESSSDKYEMLAGENARLYEQAQQSVRVREQILAIVSHDLRNPLGTILMATALARATPEAQRGALPQAMDKIQRAAERMLRLIEDLLDFANIEAARLAIRRQPQDPGAIIRETLANLEGAAPDMRLHLNAEIAPELPKVFCDRDRILQVLSNLVGNAIKATAKDGHITVGVEARGPELWFSVADDGPGISEEDMKHLFEPYWRSGGAQYKGTGLGLAIAKGIVSAHGGRIWATGEPGRGATFLFSIPTADVALLFTAPASAAAPGSKQGGAKE